MKVPIEAFNTPQIWRLSGTTAELRIYADTEFITADNQWIPAGRPGAANAFYLPVPCTIVGNVLLIPGFEIDSTVDALVNPGARYTAELVDTRRRRILFMSNFPVNTLEAGDPSLQWAEILTFRDMPAPQLSSPSLLRQIAAMISLAAGALTKSSDSNTGVTALTVAPLDPTFPIAVAENDPLWGQLQQGIGLLGARGTATVADGSVLVNEPLVTADSLIMVTPMGNTFVGTVYALRQDIVDGVSFIIRSSNEGDEGEVAWILTELV